MCLPCGAGFGGDEAAAARSEPVYSVQFLGFTIVLGPQKFQVLVARSHSFFFAVTQLGSYTSHSAARGPSIVTRSRSFDVSRSLRAADSVMFTAEPEVGRPGVSLGEGRGGEGRGGEGRAPESGRPM